MLQLAVSFLSLSALAHCTPVPKPGLFSSFLSSSSSDATGAPTQSSFKHNSTKACALPDNSPLLFRNELISANASCKPITIIYARGTTNDGNVGADVGPCFFDALEKLRPGQIAVQGVNDYKATIPEFLIGGSSTGARNINSTLDFARRKCPDTSVVLSGFSQGAEIVHSAAGLVPPQNWASVKAVMLFGDPREGQAFPKELDPGRVTTICHKGDKICDGTIFVLPPHLTYEDNADEAAAAVGKLLPKGKAQQGQEQGQKTSTSNGNNGGQGTASKKQGSGSTRAAR